MKFEFNQDETCKSTGVTGGPHQNNMNCPYYFYQTQNIYLKKPYGQLQEGICRINTTQLLLKL